MPYVTFKVIGLEFDAFVSVKPEIPTTFTCEGEPLEVEIVDLYVDGVKVNFLLESDVVMEIEDACYEACRVL